MTKMTVKDYIEEFSLLPTQIKIAAGLILFALIALLIFAGTGNYRLNRKVEKLESANKVLEQLAELEKSKAIKAEILAENEAIRADNLESELIPIEEKIKGQDENYKVQKQSSDNLRGSISDIRKRKYNPRSNANSNANAQNSDVADYERRVKERYSNANGND